MENVARSSARHSEDGVAFLVGPRGDSVFRATAAGRVFTSLRGRHTGLQSPVYAVRSCVRKTVTSKTEPSPQNILPQSPLSSSQWFHKGVEIKVSWLKHARRNDTRDLQ